MERLSSHVIFLTFCLKDWNVWRSSTFPIDIKQVLEHEMKYMSFKFGIILHEIVQKERYQRRTRIYYVIMAKEVFIR